MTLIPYESDRTRQLRYKIALLSQSLDSIEQEITDFHRAIYAFDREYQKRLGDLIEAIVLLRAHFGISEETSSIKPASTQLIDEDYQQLKKYYRQAAKLCHPDYLPDEHLMAGSMLFDTLNKAYNLQDIVHVENILWLLQSGQAFNERPAATIQADLLTRREVLLKQMIVQQKDSLEQLKIREDYDISNRDNWNILFYDYQTQLEDELVMLRNRVKPPN